MNEHNDSHALISRPKVVINFRTSSTKGGVEAYEVTTDERATEEDVQFAFKAAQYARNLARQELGLGEGQGNE